jgi:hypothetical protein
MLFLIMLTTGPLLQLVFLNAKIFMHADEHCILHIGDTATYADFHVEQYMRFL